MYLATCLGTRIYGPVITITWDPMCLVISQIETLVNFRMGVWNFSCTYPHHLACVCEWIALAIRGWLHVSMSISVIGYVFCVHFGLISARNPKVSTSATKLTFRRFHGNRCRVWATDTGCLIRGGLVRGPIVLRTDRTGWTGIWAENEGHLKISSSSVIACTIDWCQKRVDRGKVGPACRVACPSVGFAGGKAARGEAIKLIFCHDNCVGAGRYPQWSVVEPQHGTRGI